MKVNKVRLRPPTKRELLIAGIALIGGIVVLQLLYPWQQLPPGATIGGVAVAGMDRHQAEASLAMAYQQAKASVVLEGNDEPTASPAWSQLGIEINTAPEVEAYLYPWYMRLVPSSVLWYGQIAHHTSSQVSWRGDIQQRFIDKLVGKDCQIKPVDAKLKSAAAQLIVVPAEDGGRCERPAVDAVFAAARPALDDTVTITVPVTKIAPTIGTSQAEKLAAQVNSQLDKGVAIKAGSKTVSLDAKTVAAWLSSTVQGKKLVLQLDAAKSEKYLSEQLGSLVTVKPGVTHITTHDFVEVSRVNGQPGRGLAVAETGEQIVNYLVGESDKIVAQTHTIEPEKSYKRTYSSTDKGLSALMKNYAIDHKGSYGVQLIELSGKRRRAGYNADKKFTTASTYKLFVAYGTLKKIDAGSWKWSDSVVSGRNLSTCFDDMIIKSDNPCSEALLEKLGYTELTAQLHDLGLKNSSFLGKNIESTAADLATFMAMLESKQLSLSAASHSRFISALKQNQYRQGIPAGAPGAVADKVGFLWDLLHDAAIVYSPKGTYVLVIMTDKSSWSDIADLTRQIEKLR